MAKERDWQKYFELTKNHRPRPLLVEALTHVKNRDYALELGAGALNDTLFLLKENFKMVLALDKKPIAMQIAAELPKDKFQYVISNLEDYAFPLEVADLVNAQFSLPFINPKNFDEVWERIGRSLKQGGIFTGQLFGDRDEWKTNTDMTFHTEDEAHRLLSDYEIISFKEDEENRPTAEGTLKHWHVFHFIARK